MDPVSAFFQMGGYGAFIWPAFAVAALVMLALLLLSRRAWQANQAALDRLQAAGARRRRPAVAPAESRAP